MHSRRIGNHFNVHLLGRLFALGFACIAEYRAILQLMLHCDGRLSNEELNRAMSTVRSDVDIAEVASMVRAARSSDDPLLIGPRIYKDEQFGNPTTRPDQRKAMNPWFLLAGAGGVLIAFERDEEYRSIRPWARPLLAAALSAPVEVVSMEAANVSKAIDRHSCAPLSCLMPTYYD